MIYGFSAPLLILVAMASLIVATDSGAYAEGFAPLVILVMVIVAVPVIVVANMIVVPVAATENSAYFFRGMIFPAIFIAAMLIYYTGFWDKVVEPLLPQHIDKIQTAGGGRVDEDTYEFFYVVYNYEASAEEHLIIDEYMRDTYQRSTGQNSGYAKLNVNHYFVPDGHYDPIDDVVSRAEAIAVYRQEVTADGPSLVRIKPVEE